jgi:UDP-N-acetyl-D-mannosaminuronate dehydrogenase
VLIVTNHQAVDWAAIAKHARLVVDSRNAMADLLPINGTYLRA